MIGSALLLCAFLYCCKAEEKPYKHYKKDYGQTGNKITDNETDTFREDKDVSKEEDSIKAGSAVASKEEDVQQNDDLIIESLLHSKMVNINTADETELTKIRGIGPSKAKAILKYREENGSFQFIEEIMNVPGIKEGTFNKIKDSICVEDDFSEGG